MTVEDRSEPAARADLLRLEGLQVHFPIRAGLGRASRVVRAVDGIDLSIRRGEVLGLVGDSGSGKTTTGRVIAKLTRQTAGRIVFDGADVSKTWGGALKPYRRRVGMIFQDPYETLNPKQSIFDFVAEPLVVNGLGKAGADRRDRVHAALESAGLRPARAFASRYPHELSGGQRQRVVIARALASDPQVLIADEPVSMLDVSLRAGVLALLEDLRERWGISMLYITHDLLSARLVTENILVLNSGRVVERGETSQVLQHPEDPYTVQLLDAVPNPSRISK
jgi:peptide/nickel transport system ATP-binding protein